MKKKIIVLALCVLMISGCGSKVPKLSNGEEAVATFKDDSVISANDVYESIKEKYALEALINMVDKKILEDKYADDLEDAKKNAETQMEQLEQSYGDQLDSALESYGYTRDSYKEEVYIYYLRDLAIADYCKDQIKDKEITKYYKDEIKNDIKVSHILITADVTDDMTDEEKAAAESEAKEKAASIIKELKETKESEISAKFSELAEEYSDDETTKKNGGSLGFINVDTLSEDYKELVDEAYKLKDGEYSTSVVTTEIGYHVILRTETKEKASLDDVKDTIIEKLGEKYLEENPAANVKALQQLRKDYDFEITDDVLKAKYATYIQNQLNSYTQQATE